MFPNKTSASGKGSLVISIAFWVILITASNALAHNVTIFAWVEGDTVYTESKFSGGRKAKDAPIEVYDKAGNKLITGKTDENGEYSFKLPKKEELKVVLLAGMGHGNEWIITSEDIAEAQADSSDTSQPSAALPEKNTTATNSNLPQTPNSSAASTTPETNAALEKILDQKLAPLLKKLSHLEAKQKEDTGFTEIIGGIGYILGLMGLATFIHCRNKMKG